MFEQVGYTAHCICYTYVCTNLLLMASLMLMVLPKISKAVLKLLAYQCIYQLLQPEHSMSVSQDITWGPMAGTSAARRSRNVMAQLYHCLLPFEASAGKRHGLQAQRKGPTSGLHHR